MRHDKKEALRLRKLGKSYNEINKMLGIPKSTLSAWLKNLSISRGIKNKNISKARKIWMRSIIQYNLERARKARLAAKQLEDYAEKEIKKINLSELKLIGIALYWAEGYKRAKWNACFCNSDPYMVKLMMRFFREICQVPEDRFRPQVQTHPNVSVEDAEKYWSSIIKLPRELFCKPLIQPVKSSMHKRPIHRLPYGTFRVRIADAKVLYKLKGWIKGLSFSG